MITRRVYVYNLTYRVYVDHLTHSVCEHKGTRFISAVLTLTELTSTFREMAACSQTISLPSWDCRCLVSGSVFWLLQRPTAMPYGPCCDAPQGARAADHSGPGASRAAPPASKNGANNRRCQYFSETLLTFDPGTNCDISTREYWWPFAHNTVSRRTWWPCHNAHRHRGTSVTDDKENELLIDVD